MPDDNPYAFALALTRLLRNGALRETLSGEARTYAAEWSEDVLAARMAELYRQIVAGYSLKRAGDFRLLPR